MATYFFARPLAGFSRETSSVRPSVRPEASLGWRSPRCAREAERMQIELGQPGGAAVAVAIAEKAIVCRRARSIDRTKPSRAEPGERMKTSVRLFGACLASCRVDFRRQAADLWASIFQRPARLFRLLSARLLENLSSVVGRRPSAVALRRRSRRFKNNVRKTRKSTACGGRRRGKVNLAGCLWKILKRCQLAAAD